MIRSLVAVLLVGLAGCATVGPLQHQVDAYTEARERCVEFCDVCNGTPKVFLAHPAALVCVCQMNPPGAPAEETDEEAGYELPRIPGTDTAASNQ